MVKIFGTRFSLIGDTVMSLPILNYLQDKHGEIYTHFSIAQKCQQAARLFENHPLINQIKISDLPEDLGENDAKIIEGCNIVFDVRPQHPAEQDWYNYRNCVQETILMAGIDPNSIEDQIPKLYTPISDRTSQPTVAIWPFAGYGSGMARSPSVEWLQELVSKLTEKYNVWHFGYGNEPTLSESERYKKLTHVDFFDQVISTLACQLAIGTDSGSMWCVAAYDKIPQINLLTNWLPNHHSNLTALAPAGNKTINMFAHGGCSNIPIDEVIKAADENICLQR